MCPKKEISNSQAEKSGKNKSFNSNVDNHAKRRIFLQSQEKKSSSDAKEDKMKHSGNPEVITQSEIVLSKGLASILTNLRETSIDTAKKENLHIILENVSEERNISNSQAENLVRINLLTAMLITMPGERKYFYSLKTEKIPHLMPRRIR
ncbi:hypothetical protein TNCT_239722 [Trichonephila clavata]|uniref:Uncharacterized protein n=1 Tax=Trichonephila clavata TaxID=2740835 RepID=A0A8X6GWR2_TRICU|nr:hypothetical protein TNCT_239722 [Trichonephila clavata]